MKKGSWKQNDGVANRRAYETQKPSVTYLNLPWAFDIRAVSVSPCHPGRRKKKK